MVVGVLLHDSNMKIILVDDHQSRSFARRNPMTLLNAFYPLSPPEIFVLGLPERPSASAHATETQNRGVHDFAVSVCSVPRTAVHSKCAPAPRSWGPLELFAVVAHLCAHELCVLHSSTAPRRDPPRGHLGRVARQGRHGVGLGRRAGGAEAIRTPRAPPTVSRGRRSQILVARPSTLRLAAHTVAPDLVLEGVEIVR